MGKYLEQIIKDFMDMVLSREIEVYNEASLQFELGIFLRKQFERNISAYNISDIIKTKEGKEEKIVKHEIDLTISDENKKNCYAIELKFPKNGEYPGEMFKFIKDIKFMEQLKDNGFIDTFCLTLVDDELFYSKGRSKKEIYSYFRKGAILKGEIDNPIKTSTENPINIKGNYFINWIKKDDNSCRRYYFIRI